MRLEGKRTFPKKVNGVFYFISKKRNCFGAVLLLVISFHPVLTKEKYQKEKEKKMHTPITSSLSG